MPEVDDLEQRIGTLIYGIRTITYTTHELPTRKALIKLPEEEQIAVVCERYKYWFLAFAEKLEQEPNAGYAILALLNSYFEMIAQLHGNQEQGKGKTRGLVIAGLKLVFPELAENDAVATEIYERLRNPLAHMSATRDHVILIAAYDQPLVWGKHGEVDAIVINPKLWSKAIREHFDQFYLRLQDPNSELRHRFLERIHNPS